MNIESLEVVDKYSRLKEIRKTYSNRIGQVLFGTASAIIAEHSIHASPNVISATILSGATLTIAFAFGLNDTVSNLDRVSNQIEGSPEREEIMNELATIHNLEEQLLASEVPEESDI